MIERLVNIRNRLRPDLPPITEHTVTSFGEQGMEWLLRDLEDGVEKTEARRTFIEGLRVAADVARAAIKKARGE